MASQAVTNTQFSSPWAARYRGATVEDLDPPAALSLTPDDSVSDALLSAFERDYTHLTVVDATTRALLGYIAMPHLQAQLDAGSVQPRDPLSAAMTRFQRKGRAYRVITMQTPLEELEAFFRGDDGAGAGGSDGQQQQQQHGKKAGEWAQEFAVVTDENRRFVLGVATVQDLEEFVKRRPA
ncbi:hypothetical protein G3M48_007991 [Beauveria asiatica]|uniref:Cystathionine beta-synthase n=1 Tax=Beauveria asiatica TaxID=1069075 RepID=A0AAW0RL55_9HYPO